MSCCISTGNTRYTPAFKGLLGPLYYHKTLLHSKNSSLTQPLPPVPRGESYYALAKQAEYIEKDLQKALKRYTQAIAAQDRADSAIKDLVAIIHQLGRTQEAIGLLKAHLLTDQTKYRNMLQNLSRQVVQKGSRLNKFVRVSNLPYVFTPEEVKQLFTRPQRINAVECYDSYALLKFSTRSAARKTLETYVAWDVFTVDWVSITGDVAGTLTKETPHIKDKGVFLFRMFLKETPERAFYVDGPPQHEVEASDLSQEEEVQALGSLLSQLINI